MAVHIYSDNPSEVTGATLNGGHPLSQGRRAAGVTGGPDGGLAAIVAEIPTAGTISGGTVTRNPTNPVNAVRLTFRLLLRGKPV